MSSRGKYRSKGNRSRHTLGSVGRETITALAEDSPVLAMFKKAALKLNERQDRHERLVKLSRDITIESKRIIFLLHSAIIKSASEKIIQEASDRLQKLTKGPLQAIGLELENSPAYLHSRAVTAGFQEFIEARTLCSLMENKQIILYPEVQKELQYIIKNGEDGDDERPLETQLPHSDYILGICDLTGELMRKAINSISSGDSEDCFFICQVVRDLYTGYLGLFRAGREISRKMNTTHNNLIKIESAVYALHVRGEEAPPSLLLPPPGQHDCDLSHNHSDDEGYY